LKNRLLVALLQYYLTSTDLDPRLPIPITRISNDITIPPGINGATSDLSVRCLVVRALGLPRSLALYHNSEKPTLIYDCSLKRLRILYLLTCDGILGTVMCLAFFQNFYHLSFDIKVVTI
jgi:hypothetical protein